jgi:hypothetical protein
MEAPAAGHPGWHPGRVLAHLLHVGCAHSRRQRTCSPRGVDRASREIARAGEVIHWRNIKTPGQRKHLASAIAAVPDVKTISVVLCKWHLPNVSTLTDPSYFYHSTLRLLVERLSYFGQRQNDTVSMTLAQVTGHPPRKVIAYLKRLGVMPTTIEWGYLNPCLRSRPRRTGGCFN